MGGTRRLSGLSRYLVHVVRSLYDVRSIRVCLTIVIIHVIIHPRAGVPSAASYLDRDTTTDEFQPTRRFCPVEFYSIRNTVAYRHVTGTFHGYIPTDVDVFTRKFSWEKIENGSEKGDKQGTRACICLRTHFFSFVTRAVRARAGWFLLFGFGVEAESRFPRQVCGGSDWALKGVWLTFAIR